MSGNSRWGCSILVFIAFLVPVLVWGESVMPQRTVVESAPRNLTVDMVRGLYVFATGNKLYAYDLNTGQLLWSKPLNSKGVYYKVSVGKDYAVLTSAKEMIGLDIMTGGEVWHETPGRWQEIQYAYFERDTNWLWRICPNETAVYNLDTRQGHRISMEYRQGITPDEKFVYGCNTIEKSSPPHLNEFYFLEIGGKAPKKRFTVESEGQLIVRGICGNEILVSDYYHKRTPEHLLRAYDIVTGAMTREFAPSVTANMRDYGAWLARGSEYLFFPDQSGRTLCRVDCRSGEMATAACSARHTIVLSGSWMDAAGNWWFATVDDDRGYWLWPFQHDAAPRKMLDGSRFLPSFNMSLSPPYIFGQEYGAFRLSSLYKLPGLEKIAAWQGYSHVGLLSKDAVYGASYEEEQKGMVRIYTAFMHKSSQEDALFTVKGRPVAVSPDGRFLVVDAGALYDGWGRGITQKDREEYRKSNPGKTNLHLIDVQTQEVRYRYENDAAGYRVIFSPDSRLLAVSHRDTLKIVAVEEGFREVLMERTGEKNVYVLSMCFSPDGNRLLVSGAAEAYLFDAPSGRLITKFTEKARFKDTWAAGQGEGIMYRMESKLKEFVGQYTDRWKSRPRLDARFIGEGERIVTSAQGMLLRVWDAKTGRVIHTIDPKLPEQRDINGGIRNAIVLSANGNYALAYNVNGFCDGSLWNVETGRKMRSYSFNGVGNVAAAVSEDGAEVYALINGDLHYLTGATERH